MAERIEAPIQTSALVCGTVSSSTTFYMSPKQLFDVRP